MTPSSLSVTDVSKNITALFFVAKNYKNSLVGLLDPEYEGSVICRNVRKYSLIVMANLGRVWLQIGMKGFCKFHVCNRETDGRTDGPIKLK